MDKYRQTGAELKLKPDVVSTQPVKSQKVHYEQVDNFQFGRKEVIGVTKRTEYGKFVSLTLGENITVSISSTWINKIEDETYSVGIPTTKFFRRYVETTDGKRKFTDVIGSDIIKEMEAYGYKPHVLIPDTPDEVWKKFLD